MVSDLVTEGELPEEVRRSFDAWACCIGGALEKEEYLSSMRRAGFKDLRIIKESTYDLDVSEELKGKITSVAVEGRKE